jgi:hypothetical protein
MSTTPAVAPASGTVPDANPPAPKPPAPTAPASGKETRELVNAIIKGDDSRLAEFRALLDDPKRGEYWTNCVGSPIAWLRRALIERAAGKRQGLQEAIERKLDAVQVELAGPNPTPLESLLAERAAFCWFIVNRYEQEYVSAKDWSLSMAEFQHRKIDKAHARYLSALRTLAQVRKLAVPALQVNIGTNQVNVAEAGS